MSARSRMLDEALDIGRRELACLSEGDVAEAQKLFMDRDRILNDALRGLSDGNRRELADKLVEMSKLQNELSGRAKELHANLRQDLTKLKRETKRISGYSFGSGNMPRLATRRFVNKKS